MIKKFLKYNNIEYEFNYFTRCLRDTHLIIIDLLDSNDYLFLYTKNNNLGVVDRLFEYIVLHDYIDLDRIMALNLYRTKNKLLLEKGNLINNNILFLSLNNKIKYFNKNAEIFFNCRKNDNFFDINLLINNVDKEDIGNKKLSIEHIFSEIGRDIYLNKFSDDSLEVLLRVSGMNFKIKELRKNAIEKSNILGSLLSRMANNCYYVFKYNDDLSRK